jgi:glucokinase
MGKPGEWVIVGLDNGGTTNNATVLGSSGSFLIDRMVEAPSRVREGPEAGIAALAGSLRQVLELTGIPETQVRAVGLDTPGPASADGVLAATGAVNFAHPAWRGFDIRGALEARLGIPVIYSNDANAAAMYAHHVRFGADVANRSSVAAIVGTGLGGGVVEGGRLVRGAAGMAGEFGHIKIPLEGLLADGQPPPVCNCGLPGDVESIASLTGIGQNLLPFWLTRFPGHPLAAEEPRTAARLVRRYGEQGDPLAKEIFSQQAMALGRMFTIAACFTDPHAYFVGGGVVETSAAFRHWFLNAVRGATDLRTEQAAIAEFALVPDLDMAGARGAALAAREAIRD